MSGLQSFLADEEHEDTNAPAPEQAQPEPEPERRSEPEQRQPEPEARPESQPEPQNRQPNEREGDANVPRRAYEEERRRRQEREAEAADLRRQLEAFQRGQQQPQAQQPQLPDPEKNPAGYLSALIQHQREETQRAIVDQRFNVSEAMLRQRIGDAEVDAMVSEFQEAAQREPVLGAQIHQQRDPFGWAWKQVQAMRLQKEIGDDPSAYRARVEAEIRERMQQEAAAQMNGGVQQRQAPPPQGRAAPRQQPSIAGARSVAGRDTVDDGDEPLGDILRR